MSSAGRPGVRSVGRRRPHLSGQRQRTAGNSLRYSQDRRRQTGNQSGGDFQSQGQKGGAGERRRDEQLGPRPGLADRRLQIRCGRGRAQSRALGQRRACLQVSLHDSRRRDRLRRHWYSRLPAVRCETVKRYHRRKGTTKRRAQRGASYFAITDREAVARRTGGEDRKLQCLPCQAPSPTASNATPPSSASCVTTPTSADGDKRKTAKGAMPPESRPFQTDDSSYSHRA